MARRNHVLKGLMFRDNLTLADMTEKTKIPAAYLSLAVNGKYNLDADQKARVAVVFDCKVSDLFQDR